jgi:hypothetical protein
MRRFCQISLLSLLLLSSLLILVPAFLIRPFVGQTAQGVAIAYTLRTVSPLLTLFCLLLGVLLSSWIWKTTKTKIRRIAILLSVIVLVSAAILSRQNYFEWMFNPLKHPGFVTVSRASHIQDSDMVLSVQISEETRAYPVRIMAYHHIINDIVGGVPIAVTY